MKPLIVLILAFFAALLTVRFTYGGWNFKWSGNIAMSVMLLFTAIAHFAYTKGMEMMLPQKVPFKKIMVYLTGLIEIAAAIGLLVPALQYLTACLLIVFLLFILPANIYAASKNVDYQEGTYNGPGHAYLWFRIPLQLFFIAWISFCNW